MSDALISSQQAEINRLNRLLAQTRAETKRFRTQYQEAQTQLAQLTAERDQAHESLQTLEKDRDEWQKQAETNPTELQKQVAELTGQLRTRDHHEAWKAAVGDQLHEKVDIAKLWNELNYTPGEAVPTPDQIQEQVGRARELAPYLFRQGGQAPPSAQGAQYPPGRLHVPPGGSRAAPDTSSGRMIVSRSRDLTNAEWMRTHQAALGEASKAGSIDWVD